MQIVSFNTFGLPNYMSWQRIADIAAEVTRLDAEVLCFQEIQQKAYIGQLKNHLPRHAHLAYGVEGHIPMGNLVTASTLAPVRTEFKLFPNRGRLLSIGFADWFSYKGCLLTEFNSEGQKVVVMNTHTNASYLAKWDPDSPISRIQRDQVAFLAEMGRSQPEDAFVVICGDFNFPRGTKMYDEMIEKSGFFDPLAGDQRPTYQPVSMLKKSWSIPLDFFFCRQPAKNKLIVRADIQKMVNPVSRFPYGRFLSDHFAIILNLEKE
jgi:endonuclease/exonuclease/phosphatase family metal-dependent hydrolase